MLLHALVAQVLPVCISTAAWITSFNAFQALSSRASSTYRTLTHADQLYWASCCCSNLHALIVVPLSLHNLSKGIDFTDHLRTDPASAFTFQVFLGYMLADLCALLRLPAKTTGRRAFLLHHTVCVVAWGYLLVGDFGHTFGLLAILSEITAPCTNGRWFLSKCGYKRTSLYLVNGVALTIAWFSVRVFGGISAGFVMFARNRKSLDVLSTPQQVTLFGAYAIGMALQFMWGYAIAIGLYKVLRVGTKKETKIA
jgi:hypothetical protein